MGIEAVLFGTTVASAVSSISAGQQQRKAYELQANQAQMQAESQITERTRALTDALAAQRAFLGASGRTPESITSVIEGDKKRYEQDVNLIRASGGAQSAQSKMAAGAASTQGYLNAASSIGQGYVNYSMLKK